MKLRVIAPIVLNGTTPDSVEEYLRAAPSGCQVEVTFLDRGPASIESEYEESLATPDIVAKTREAAAEVYAVFAAVACSSEEMEQGQGG